MNYECFIFFLTLMIVNIFSNGIEKKKSNVITFIIVKTVAYSEKKKMENLL